MSIIRLGHSVRMVGHSKGFQSNMGANMKVVGRRIKERHSIEEADALLGLAQVLRSDRAFVPKGVYRFKTHEEANRWQFQMILGQKPGSPE